MTPGQIENMLRCECLREIETSWDKTSIWTLLFELIFHDSRCCDSVLVHQYLLVIPFCPTWATAGFLPFVWVVGRFIRWIPENQSLEIGRWCTTSLHVVQCKTSWCLIVLVWLLSGFLPPCSWLGVTRWTDTERTSRGSAGVGSPWHGNELGSWRGGPNMTFHDPKRHKADECWISVGAFYVFSPKNPSLKGRKVWPYAVCLGLAQSKKTYNEIYIKLQSFAFQRTMCCPKCCRGRCCACLGGCGLGVVFSIMVVSSVIMATSYPLLKWLSAHKETIQEVGTCLNATALKANQTLTHKLSAECWDLLCDKCDGDEFLRFQCRFFFFQRKN